MTLQKLKVLGLVLVLVSLSAGSLGLIFGWHRHFPLLDELNHSVTSLGLALLLMAYARASVFRGTHGHLVWQWLLIAGAILGLGGLWEISEWVFDQALQGNVIKGKTDTIVDLMMDALGALVGAGIGLQLARSSRSGFEGAEPEQSVA